jgi:hypothetical protein
MKTPIKIHEKVSIPEGKHLYRFVEIEDPYWDTNFVDKPDVFFRDRQIGFVFQSLDEPNILLSIKTPNYLSALNNNQNLTLRLLEELNNRHIMTELQNFTDVKSIYGKICFLKIEANTQKPGKTTYDLVLPDRQINLPSSLRISIVY